MAARRKGDDASYPVPADRPHLRLASELPQASELGDVLKGCSLYLIGFGPKRTTIGRVLAKRLGRYRAYDVSSLMCSTYKALSGGSDDVTLQQLLAKEPLADVEQLAYAILREVQPFSRTIVVGWEGAVAPADFAIMQQGIVVHLETEVACPT